MTDTKESAGADAAVRMTRAGVDLPKSALFIRQCGDCTVCCSGVLRLEVDGQAVRPGQGCRHCRHAGCGIYDVRPTICREFVCGWLRDDSVLPLWLRPDRSGMILLPAYRRWCGVPVDVAVAAGAGAQAESLRWLKRFSALHRRPLLYQVEVDGEWCAFGPPGFQTDLRRFLERGGSLFKQ